MDVVKLWELLLRRKLVTLVAIVLAVGLLGAAYTTAPPRYVASGSIVLLNPEPKPSIPGQPETVTQNRLLLFNDLSVVVDILVRRMRSPGVQQELVDSGADGDIVFGANLAFYNGPIIDVTVESGSIDGAIGTVDLAIDALANELRTLQLAQNVPEDELVTVSTVVSPEQASRLFSSTLRRILAAGVVGVGIVFGLTGVVDAFQARRLRRRRGLVPTPPARPAVEVEPARLRGVPAPTLDDDARPIRRFGGDGL